MLQVLGMLLPFAKGIVDKFWMDKGEKERLEFTKEEMKAQLELALKQMEIDGAFKEADQIFREVQAQRDYAQKQFGSAEVLMKTKTGRLIMMGRASIRWVITGVSMMFTYKILNAVLTADVLAALAAGTMSVSAVWVIAVMVCMVVGIPLFYVAGISVEKLLKSRGVI